MARANDPYDIVIVNAPKLQFFDLYHQMLRAPWWVDFALITAVFIVSNLLFALAFWGLGGVEHASSFADHFYFSVQTMGTIGYGNMYPVGAAANLLVVAEAVFGIILVALFTGLVFSKFSVLRGLVRFAAKVTVSPVDGVPTLMMRCGNQRSNQLVEARVRVALVRTEFTKEGTQLYRMHDLKLVRDSTPLFARAWTVFHRIEEGSPLFGATPQSLDKDEAELVVTLVGTDEHSNQTVYSRYRYFASDIVYGARHADLLSEPERNLIHLDLSKFDQLLETKRTEVFPYP
jgi:inward rectifier potassium channel